jgi:hypothetical protein
VIVKKIRGQNKIGKILLSISEIYMAKRMSMSVEEYANIELIAIAKKRRWKWFFDRDKNVPKD